MKPKAEKGRKRKLNLKFRVEKKDNYKTLMKPKRYNILLVLYFLDETQY